MHWATDRLSTDFNLGTGNMAQLVREPAMQAWEPDFNSQSPGKSWLWIGGPVISGVQEVQAGGSIEPEGCRPSSRSVRYLVSWAVG